MQAAVRLKFAANFGTKHTVFWCMKSSINMIFLVTGLGSS